MKGPILVGDIGGTNCRLALAEIADNQVSLRHTTRFQNAGVSGLQQHIERFFEDTPRPEAAIFAVAGPTDGITVKFTNLDWDIDADALRRHFGFKTSRLVNDFIAVGHGLSVLQDADCKTLQPGQTPPCTARLAAGAGTGLGVVTHIWTGSGYLPLASEGGHISFAPADDEQIALLRFLLAEHGADWGQRVSVDRLVSGRGIAYLYRFCRSRAGQPDAPEQEIDPARISRAAMSGEDAFAVQALKLFCRLYGQTVGDLALINQTQGGVYLAGGIAPQILPFLEGPDFLEGFCHKGRFSEWMRTVPVHVVLDPDIGLKGAAIAAG